MANSSPLSASSSRWSLSRRGESIHLSQRGSSVSSSSSNPRHSSTRKVRQYSFLRERAVLVDDELNSVVEVCSGLEVFRRLQQRVLVQARPGDVRDKLGPID
jgi:hypothetical protein